MIEDIIFALLRTDNARRRNALLYVAPQLVLVTLQQNWKFRGVRLR